MSTTRAHLWEPDARLTSKARQATYEDLLYRPTFTGSHAGWRIAAYCPLHNDQGSRRVDWTAGAILITAPDDTPVVVRSTTRGRPHWAIVSDCPLEVLLPDRRPPSFMGRWDVELDWDAVRAYHAYGQDAAMTVSGLAPSALHRLVINWEPHGVGWWEAHRWTEVLADPVTGAMDQGEALRYRQAGWTPEQLGTLHRCVVDAATSPRRQEQKRESGRWRDSGLLPHHVLAAIGAGLTAQEAKALGVPDDETIAAWKCLSALRGSPVPSLGSVGER